MANDPIFEPQPSTSTANEFTQAFESLEIKAIDEKRAYCYLDDCNGILQGIPNSFDLGTIPVHLTCVSVSPSYLALGSACGALFLYNRRLNRNVNPLRTSFKEVVTCIELFYTEEDDFLAIGHRSGTVILLCLPSRNPNGNRKIKQSIQEDAHKDNSIACMTWNDNGSRLYTADLSGLIMVTEVDFGGEVYNCIFVHTESRPIVQLISQNNLLAFCTSEKFSVIDSITNSIIFERSHFDCDIQDVFMCQNQLTILTADGHSYRFPETSKSLHESFPLADLTRNAHKPRNFVLNGRITTEIDDSTWNTDDFSLSRAEFSCMDQSTLVLCSSEKVLIVYLTEHQPECFLYDLEKFLHDSDFEIIDFSCDMNSEEVFILTSTRRLLRLAKTPSQVSLVHAEEQPSLISSFTETAQKSYNLFEKFKKTDEFERLKQLDKFINLQRIQIPSQFSNLPNLTNMTEQIKNMDLKNANIEQTGKNLASNLFKVIDNIKSSSLVTELQQNAQNLYTGQNIFTSPTSSQASSPSTRILESQSDTGDGHESSSSRGNSFAEKDHFLEKLENHQTHQTADVAVNRKSKTAAKKKFKPKVVSPKLEEDEEVAPKSDSTVQEPVIAEENMDKMLKIIGLITETESSIADTTSTLKNGTTETVNELPQEPITNVPEESPSKIGRLSSVGYTFDDDQMLEQEGQAEGQSSAINSDLEPSIFAVVESLNTAHDESDLESFVNKACNKAQKEKQQEPGFLEDAEFVHRTPNDTLEAEKKIITEHQNPEYAKILKLSNQFTDIWSRIQLPYEINSFDVCSSYVVVTSKKSKQKPQFLQFNNIDSGALGGEWVRMSSNATAVAVNDTGNLLWRVDKGVAYAPLHVNPRSPEAVEWVEQASQGTVLSVSLTSKHAWYLTTKGVFVQMNLPEMGILFHAECPFQLSSLVASDHAVWGIRSGVGTLVVRVGLEKCPMGFDWVEDCLAGPKRFVSVALHEKSGWALDPNGVLWFNNCVQEMTPFGVGDWFQVCSPMFLSSPDAKKFLPVSKWTLKVSSSGVFLHVGKVILVARQPLTGHRFPYAVPERMSVYDNFSMIAAAAFSSVVNDQICVCLPNSEIFLYSIHKKNFISLPGFDRNLMIASITASKDRIYVLDMKGKVHYHEGLKNFSMMDSHFWKRMQMEQLDEEMKVLSIAVSEAMIWLISEDGSIWAKNSNGDSNWKRIDRPKLGLGEMIVQIRTSPSGNYVWVFSRTSGKAWTRVGISETNHKGTLWSEASTEIKIADLAVGDHSVWALSSTNHLYKLRCLSEANPVGLLWKSLPIQLIAISVDAYESRLWGLDMKNRIMDIYPRCAMNSSDDSLEDSMLEVLENSQHEQDRILNESLPSYQEVPRKESEESDVSMSWNDTYFALNRSDCL